MTEINGEPVCATCHQPLPGSTPYRGGVPAEQNDEETPFAAIQSKLSFGWSWLKYNTPKPISWMAKSLGWVAVGTIVVSAASVAGYFIIRYLMWALIVMLGKWLLDRIGRGIPRVVDGMAISVPHADFGYWEVGFLGIVGIITLASIGKIIVSQIKKSK